ncbi:MAG: hypothetical protein WCG90_08185 [Chitinophagia bacterium]
MITIAENNNTIELFGSIKELPITRYRLLQSLLIQDSGIGADMAAVDERLQRLILFVTNEKNQEAKEEAMNMRYTFFSMLNKISYKSKAFACFVWKINGLEQKDISDEGLKNTVDVIEKLGVSMQQLEDWFEDVKKKLIPN